MTRIDGVFLLAFLQGVVFAAAATIINRRAGIVALGVLTTAVAAWLALRGYWSWQAAIQREIPLVAILLAATVPPLATALSVYAMPRTRAGAATGVGVGAVLYLVSKMLAEAVGIYYLA